VGDVYLQPQEPNIAFRPKLDPDVVVSESSITIECVFRNENKRKNEDVERVWAHIGVR